MRRAVVTGIGVVAPGSPHAKAYWDLLTTGRTATRRITAFDPSPYRSQVAAECDFNAIEAGLTAEQATRMDRAAQFAVVAAREALRDSELNLDLADPGRIGVSIGSAVGNTTSLEREYVTVSEHGRLWEVDHEASVAPNNWYLVPSSLACEVAWETRAEGPVQLVSNGCTSGLDAVGYAARLIEEGSTDITISGGTDAPISPITVACFDAIKATTPFQGNPAQASRPFDATRDGFVLGEGAAILVLEEREHARRRGARIYCEVAGFASRSNAYHMTGLRPDGHEMAEAIRTALDQARVDRSEVDYVNAHGSGTKQNDRHETAAVKTGLGHHAFNVPMSSIKSMIGHSLGAIGALELAACALALHNSVVPPTANLTSRDPECDLDYVPVTARERRLRNIISVGSGFGGFQSAVVLSGRR
jgi:act minimal PKS ketosynthase (KS/KS alpha)